jgi:diguanylate cyclase (GGDEF)-like protein
MARLSHPFDNPSSTRGDRAAADGPFMVRVSSLRDWLPAGGGLRDIDWARRHRMLTLMLAGGIPSLMAYGVLRHRAAGDWLPVVLLMLACVVGALTLPGRRAASSLVALGSTVMCAGFVSLSDGLTEAHFTFFIAVAALALYRDWVPFGVFLVATTLDHAVVGTLVSGHMYDHRGAATHPLLWAALHGGAVLLAATCQVVGWRLSEGEERRAQENLDDSQAQLSIAFDETPVPMAMIRPDGQIIRTNAAYRGWLRLPDELPPGYAVKDLPITPLDGDAEPELERLIVGSGGDAVTLTRHYRRHDDGSDMWVDLHGTGLCDRLGEVKMIVVHCLDVTSSHLHADQLRHQVRHDSLTGLLSRTGFDEDLAAMLAAGTGAGVLYLDVDRFKSVNDGHGHGAGNEALRTLAARLAATAPAGTLLARISGDEFVLAVPGGREAGLTTAQGVLAAAGEPLEVLGRRVQLAVSIGLAVAHGQHGLAAMHGLAVAYGDQTDDAVLSADTAMYAAKQAGGNRVVEFSDDMRVSVRRRVESEARLREALDGDLIETLPVWFQPVVAAPSGRVIGAEALVRMLTPDGRILAPGHFIGVAEETGLVVPLGEHVLRRAVDHLIAWGDDLGYVSVNVSPRQLAEPGFVPMLADLLAAHDGLDPARIVLEITETALLGSSADVQDRLQTIKSLGFRIALDDFGTGYSSLTWLQSVPADVVKLDRSFVAGLAHDPKKSSIISAVLWLARSLGMSVTAEGVEDAADWDELCAAECPAVQGYYISKPLPPAEFEAFLCGVAVPA